MEPTRTEEGKEHNPEPMFRDHCRGCSAVTLAPRGQTNVACKTCGKEVGDTSFALDECRRSLADRLELLQVRQGFKDYARADAEVTVHLVRMSKELALATLYQQVK